MDNKNNSFSPDDANRLRGWQCLSIVAISVISVIMIIIGALPTFAPPERAPSFAQTVLCVLLMLSGVFILYSILFNIFRIIERNQRRTYEWERDRATGRVGVSKDDEDMSRR